MDHRAFVATPAHIRDVCPFLGVLRELTCRTVAVLDLLKTPEEHGADRSGGIVRAMHRDGVRERPGRPAHRAGGPAFDLVVSKLRRPVIRRGTVPRFSLIDRLARDDLSPMVSVIARRAMGNDAVGRGATAPWLHGCRGQ